MGTEEENRSVGRTGYYVFDFLFRVLVAAGRPRFRLVLRDRAVGSRTIKGRNHRESSYRKSTFVGGAIGGATSIRGKVVLEEGRTTD